MLFVVRAQRSASRPVAAIVSSVLCGACTDCASMVSASFNATPTASKPGPRFALVAGSRNRIAPGSAS